MTFTSGIPQSGQSLGQTRDPIRNNFTNYFNTMSVDHVAPNSTGAGKHNQSTYTSQASDPATLNTEVDVYSKTVSGVVQLFQRLASSGAVIPFTPFFTTSTVVVNAVNVTQYTLNFAGIQFAFGSCRAVGGFPTSSVVPFGVAFNVANQPSVLLTIEDPNATSKTLNVASTPSNTSFTIKCSANVSFSYIAFGLP